MDWTVSALSLSIVLIEFCVNGGCSSKCGPSRRSASDEVRHFLGNVAAGETAKFWMHFRSKLCVRATDLWHDPGALCALKVGTLIEKCSSTFIVHFSLRICCSSIHDHQFSVLVFFDVRWCGSRCPDAGSRRLDGRLRTEVSTSQVRQWGNGRSFGANSLLYK